MARKLNDYEVQLLFTDNPAVYDLTTAHDQFVSRFGWDQVGWAQVDTMPIPVRGYVTSDPNLGTVIIFPDSAGTLHYLVTTTPDENSLAQQIMLPGYESPDPGFVEGVVEQLNAMVAGVQGSSGQVVNALIIVGAILLYTKLK